MTFAGGQFACAVDVVGAEAFPAALGSDGAELGEVEPGAAWPPAAGAQLEVDGTTFFLCCFGVVCAFCPEDALAGGATTGACDVFGACAGGGASCVSGVLEVWLAGAADGALWSLDEIHGKAVPRTLIRRIAARVIPGSQITDST
jgi:hypothetical protein